MATEDDLALDLLALAAQELFLEQWRAGRRPRLSVYARRYPAYAAALAELVASLPMDAREPGKETLPESFSERLWAGVGANRALAMIFDSGASQRDDASVRRVAEEPGLYQTRPADPPSALDPANDQSDHG